MLSGALFDGLGLDLWRLDDRVQGLRREARYEGRIDDAAGFARANRVLLLRSGSGVGIDVALGGLPFEESVIARASRFAFPGRASLLTCSAEDMIVLKAFAARGRDRVDIEGVIVRQHA